MLLRGFLGLPPSTWSRTLTWMAKQRLAATHLAPTNKLLITTEEGNLNSSAAQLIFVFPTENGKTFYLNRLLNEPWKVTASKIQDRLNSTRGEPLLEKKPKKKKHMKRDEDEDVELLKGNIWALSEDGEPKELDPETPLREVISGNKSLRMEDTDYALCINPHLVKKIKFPLDIIEGAPLFLAVDMYFGPVPLIHWFIEEEIGAEFDIRLGTVEHKDGVRQFSFQGWKHRGTGKFYVPDMEDVEKRVLVVVDPGPNSVVAAECTSNWNTVSRGLSTYLWSDRQQNTASFCSSSDYRIVSYNILADLYLDLKKTQRELYYPYCPKEYQKPSYRYPLLMKELPGYHADILCLQEVDFRFWMRFLETYMKQLGWMGQICLKGGMVNEGLAVFYRRDRLRFLMSHDVCLSDLMSELRHPGINMDLKAVAEQNETVNTLIVTRPTVLQVSVLEDEATKCLFVVANTHLHFAPSQTYVRLVQTALCVRHLEDVVKAYKEKYPEHRVSVIWCADLNSTDANGSVQFLLNGSLSNDHPEWQGTAPDGPNLRGVALEHSFRFLDTCNQIPYTNYTVFEEGKGFEGRLDYIFVEDQDWELKSVLPPPDHSLVTQYGALPSAIAPSDHLPIACDLSLKR